MLAYLLQGIVLGFAAGISPGPMLGLVINQTLRRGWRAGNIVALAPLLSDAPIIVVMVLVLGHLPTFVLNIVSLLGGTFVVYLGIETVRSVRSEVAVDNAGGLRKNIAACGCYQSHEPAPIPVLGNSWRYIAHTEFCNSWDRRIKRLCDWHVCATGRYKAGHRIPG